MTLIPRALASATLCLALGPCAIAMASADSAGATRAAGKGTASVVTVGSDDACDVDARVSLDPIEEALDLGADEIRVSRQEALTLSIVIDRSVALVGGFEDCGSAAAGTAPAGRSWIDARTIGPTPLTILGDGALLTVRVANFEISGSRQPANGPADFAGGLTIFETAGAVRLENLLIEDNESDLTGGLAVRNSALPAGASLELRLEDVMILDNTGGSAGGLSCHGEEDTTTIRVLGASGVSFNRSESGAGGLLISGCEVLFESGTATPGRDDPRGIHGNEANGFGGGIGIYTGALSLLGSDDEPVNVSANHADLDDDNRGDGGGIYLSGEATIVADRVALMDNISNADGGALAARFGVFRMGTASRGCRWNPVCNELSGNRADNGGAIHAEDSATVELASIEGFGNRARQNSSFLNIRDGEVSVTINSALIHGNGGEPDDEFRDAYLIRTNFGAHQLRIWQSTIVDNRVAFASIVGYSGSDDRFELLASIVDDPGVPAVTSVPAGGDGLIECVLLGDRTGADRIAGDNVVEGLAAFADRGTGNYRLTADSLLAIDQCAPTLVPTPIDDVDGDPRPLDIPTVADVQGPLDLGFDEWRAVVDILFRSGFEG